MIYSHVTTVFCLICDCLLISHWAEGIHKVDYPFCILDNVRHIHIVICRLKLTIAYRPTLIALHSPWISLVQSNCSLSTFKYSPWLADCDMWDIHSVSFYVCVVPQRVAVVVVVVVTAVVAVVVTEAGAGAGVVVAVFEDGVVAARKTSDEE